MTQWVLPFGSEQRESNKCAVAAFLLSTVFHVRQKTQTLISPESSEVMVLSASSPCPLFHEMMQLHSRGRDAKQAVWHLRGTETSASAQMLPSHSGQGSDGLNRNKHCISQLMYTYMHRNCSSSILESLTMRWTELPEEVGK